MTDLVIIGGGPAGMSAAIAAYEKGIRNLFYADFLADSVVYILNNTFKLVVKLARTLHRGSLAHFQNCKDSEEVI